MYGQDEAKKQIEQIIAQWINGEMKGYCFGFEGPPGTGKTSLAKNGNNVYQYHFTRRREGSEKILSYHGAEIPYVFNTHDEWLPTNKDDIELTKAMMEYWTEFAKKGTPNSINNPTWKEFGIEENYLILDQTLENSNKLENEFCEIMIGEMVQRASR